jgi:hypothetical protein
MNTAVFWDIENVSPQVNKNLVQTVLNKIRAEGRICCAMAFGDWGNNSIKTIASELHANNFRLIHIPNSGKNSADLSLVAHGMEALFKYPHIQRYILISGDADFRDLLMFQKEYGKEVWIICNMQTASKDFLKIADKSIDYGVMIREEKPEIPEKTEPEAEIDTADKYASDNYTDADDDEETAGIETEPQENKPAERSLKKEALLKLKKTITEIKAEGKEAYPKNIKEKEPIFGMVRSFGFEDWTDFVQEAEKHGLSYKGGIFSIQNIEDLPILKTLESEKKPDEAIKELLNVLGDNTLLLSQLGEKNTKINYKKYGYPKLKQLISEAEKQGFITVYESNKSATVIKKK